jgi:hypothetical protein
VGNGASIDVWSDPWPPNSPTRNVFTPRGRIMIGKAEELINPSTGSWGVHLLEEFFYPCDAHRIMALPLSPWDAEDIVAWQYNQNDMFSVKSAYHMEWKHQYGSHAMR